VQEHHDGVLLVAVVAGRQIDVEVAALKQRARPDAVIFAVVGRVIDDLAPDAVIDDVDLVAVLAPARGVGRPQRQRDALLASSSTFGLTTHPVANWRVG